VLVEALVLRCDERVADNWRNLIELDDGSTLETDLGDEAAIGGVELRCLARRVLIQDFDRGTPAGATDERPARIEESDGEGDRERGTDEGSADDARMPRSKTSERGRQTLRIGR